MSDPWAAYPMVEGGAATAPPEADPWANFPALNVPTGEVRSGNAGPMPPVTSPAIIDDRDRGASLATIARASLAPNTDDQIRRFAAARFPSLPVDEAVKRYGVDRDGNIIYSDPVTGQLVREVPTIGRGEGIGEKFMRAGSQIASGAGPAIPAVAAGVVGAMTGPTGASIPAAGLAAGAADAGRQAIDRYFANEDPSKIDWGNVAGQAALNAGGQALGVGMNKLLQRNPLGVQQYDRLTARDPVEQQRWADLYAEARRRGVDLTVGEASNLRSIRSQERALRTLPETTDKFDDFIRTRNTEQVPAAVRAEMDRLAPSRNVGEGANMLRQGADDVLSGMSKARTTAASPHYQAAFRSGVEPDVTPVIQDIEARLAKVGEATPTGRGLRAMLNALTEADPTTGQRVPISNYEKLHSIKESFDDIVSGAFDVQQTSAGKRAARDMAGTKAELMDVLKSAHPGYAQGASIYSQMSVPIQEARKGALNALLDKEGPASIRYAEALFDAAKDIPPADSLPSPEMVSRVPRVTGKVAPIEDRLIVAFAGARDLRLQAEKIEEEARTKLLTAMGDAEVGQGSAMLAQFKEVSQRKLDASALKAAHPAIVAEFTRTTSYRKLTTKEIN